MIIVVFQNLIAYSINMADNLMLGMYSQSSLSGVATVNQIQFLLQQMTLAIGDTLVIIASQYWGQKNTKPIRTFTGIALMTGLLLGLIIFALTTLFPREILMLFTKKESYIIQGMDYLSLIRFTYPLFVLSTIIEIILQRFLPLYKRSIFSLFQDSVAVLFIKYVMGTCDTNPNRNLRPLIRRRNCSQFCLYNDVSVFESYNYWRSLSICCIDRNNDRGKQRNSKSKRIQ